MNSFVCPIHLQLRLWPQVSSENGGGGKLGEGVAEALRALCPSQRLAWDGISRQQDTAARKMDWGAHQRYPGEGVRNSLYFAVSLLTPALLLPLPSLLFLGALVVAALRILEASCYLCGGERHYPFCLLNIPLP